MADTTFEAAAESIGGLSTRCTSRDMSFVLDEPPSLGGTDTGMNPVEALLSALGACKCIVAQAFAQARGIRLRGVRIECAGTLDPDGFLGLNPEAKIGFSTIETTYRIDADNPPEEIAAFVAFIEDHCPVHDTLTHPAQLTHRIA